jgi:branched-chain amino acid transport system substrate-binding protein
MKTLKNIALCLLFAAAGLSDASAQAKGGAAPAPILIGQSAGMTGGQADYSLEVKTGIEASFQAINKAGGVHGRPLKLVTLDDRGKKSEVVANTEKLVQDDRVLALIGYTSGAGVESVLPYIDSHRVPMLSPATGNMGIRASLHRNLFHTRAGYNEEMNRVVSQLALTGIKRMAIVYLHDVGPANPKAMHDALAAQRLAPVAAVSLDRNAEDFRPQIDILLKAEPEAVLFISNGPPITRIVREMRARGYGGQFATSSFSGMRVIDDLKKDAPGLIMSQVLPSIARKHLKIIREYHRDLLDSAPEAVPNATSLEGYIAARVLIEGLLQSGRNPTGERLVEALEGLKRLDLGGYEISYSPTSHDGSRYVDIGVVSNERALRF